MVQPLPKIITSEEYEYFRDAVREVAIYNRVTYYQTFLDFGRYAGLRMNETINVKLEHINFSEGLLTIPNHNNKRQHERIALPRQLMTQLRIHCSQYSEQIKETGYLFFAIQGTQGNINYQTAKAFIQRLRKHAHLNDTYGTTRDGRTKYILSYHTLRHLYGTQIQEQGGDIHKTQICLRHNSIQSTIRYTNTSIEYKKKIINQIFNQQ